MDMKYHLSMNLKRLRLPAILDNLDIRLNEARDNDLGYLEFLSLLLQDEIANRDANMLTKKLKAGGFSPRLTFESFDFRFNGDALAPQTVRDLATCHFVDQNRNLVLSGPPGIGNYVKFLLM